MLTGFIYLYVNDELTIRKHGCKSILGTRCETVFFVCHIYLLHYRVTAACSIASINFSASIAAIQPLPAAVIA